MFLSITDYEQTIPEKILSQITEGNDTNRIQQELTAQSAIEDYLRARYDVATIFAQVGSARHKTIVRYMLAITLFLLHKRIAPDRIPETRTADYDEAIEWLKAVAAGKITPDLPKNVDIETGAPQKGTFVTSKKGRIDLDY